MDKEQVINKLEEVFDVACKRFVESDGCVDDFGLSEIKELGQVIIHARTNIASEVEKAKSYIHSSIHNYLAKHHLVPIQKQDNK